MDGIAANFLLLRGNRHHTVIAFPRSLDSGKHSQKKAVPLA
jgi:hypothetical protein